ncbi:MAG: DUF2135 domain-containing protein [Paludibacteraceae bacterium]|nr:DUF2135 domain-containing protein [Paludibacteraceae bacterium]
MVGKKLSLLFSVWATFSIGAMAQLGLPTVENKANKGSIELHDLKINVEVVGNVATTTFDMTFYNSSNRILEGEFEFPLAEGQTVSRYALDIDGKLREGVVVEKEKGRTVFESKVRENVDPGLLEMTAGNNFRTRIYPFQPQNTRHIVVACEQELSTSGGKRFYRLPINSNQHINNFTLEINVRNEQDKPVVSKGSMDDVYFNPKDKGYTSHLSRKNITLKKGLFFEIPNTEFPNIYTENAGINTYFYLYSSVKPKESMAREKAKGLTVVYDVSSSSDNRNLNKDFELLERYANYLGLSKIRLVTFSYKQHLDTLCQVSDVKKIINPNKPNFDGGTQMGCLDLSKFGSDEVLFFSDGLGNIGKDAISSSKATVITINSNPVADHLYLKMLALKNGGSYINLCNLNADEALKVLTNVEYRFIKAKYDGSQISEVYPSVPTRVNESFSSSGIMKSKEADITLYFGYGNRVTDSVTCHISAINPISANNVKRLWAQRKLADLDLEAEKNKQEIIDLSKEFGIVTRNTSLIVLETVRDYVRYEITPPDELKDEYLRLMANKPKKVLNDTLHMKDVVTARGEFLKWWKTDFDPNAKPKKVTKSEVAFMMEVEEDLAVVVDERTENMSVESPAVEEAVEVGYGRRRQSARTAALSLVGGGSGVQASSSGQPGAAPTIRIRGVSSLTGLNEPAISNDVSSIEVQYWTPDVPYLSKLKSVPNEKMYEYYLELKKEYSLSPSFYLDVAEYFHREKLTEEAIRILSNLAELKLEDAEVARSCANKLVEFKEYGLAASVYERVVKMRGEEPQSYRDLAMVYSELGQYQKAADLLYKVSSSQWDPRFRNIQQIAINELNALIELNPGKIDTSAYDKRLLGNCPVDIRIILTWNTNDCDIDLWVTDPNGEKCYYQHKETAIGGRNSDDITQGYGPEEFCLKKAIKGEYKIQADYYGTRNQKQLQPVVVQATIYTHFGMPNQEKQVLTIQLGKTKEVYTVGTVNF